MEIKITPKQILKVLHVVSWIIFIGLCIEAGGILTNVFFTLVINANAASNFWGEINLLSLVSYDKGHFMTITFLMSIVAILKVILFYLIVKILHDKKIDFSQPFNNDVTRFIANISYIAVGIGLFSQWGAKYTDWLVTKGVTMPNLQNLHFEGADVWMFMGIVLLVIVQIFKRGVEIQSENELTI
ncbi:MAG: DUF2975 domain-containing protein [Bacteroidales bacterium]